jgi:hypothetical protein
VICLAIIKVNRSLDRQTLADLGFELDLAEWVEAVIDGEHAESNKYEAIYRCENGDVLSVVFYFDEDSTTLLGIDEVVCNAFNSSLAYMLETTPVWSRLQPILAPNNYERADIDLSYEKGGANYIRMFY